MPGICGKRARCREDIRAAIDEREHVGRFGCLRIAVASKTQHPEPTGLKRLRQASREPWIVDEVGHHCAHERLKWIEGVDRHCRRRVIAIEYGQPTVRTKYAIGFAQRDSGLCM